MNKWWAKRPGIFTTADLRQTANVYQDSSHYKCWGIQPRNVQYMAAVFRPLSEASTLSAITPSEDRANRIRLPHLCKNWRSASLNASQFCTATQIHATGILHKKERCEVPSVNGTWMSRRRLPNGAWWPANIRRCRCNVRLRLAIGKPYDSIIFKIVSRATPLRLQSFLMPSIVDSFGPFLVGMMIWRITYTVQYQVGGFMVIFTCMSLGPK